MDQLDDLLSQIREWTEQVLLKGLAKMDEKDMTELGRLAALSQEWDMDFLNNLLQAVAKEGMCYLKDTRVDFQRLAQSYFFLCQYVKMAEEMIVQEQ